MAVERRMKRRSEPLRTHRPRQANAFLALTSEDDRDSSNIKRLAASLVCLPHFKWMFSSRESIFAQRMKGVAAVDVRKQLGRGKKTKNVPLRAELN